MGITVSPASSSGGGGGSSGTLPVIPGTAVTREIYTDTGFTTGDYVYRYGNGRVGNIFPISFTSFSLAPILNGSTASFILGTSSVAKSDIIAPQRFPSSVTYTGATKTYAANVQAATVLQATSNPAHVETALLTNGNIVTVFNTTAATTTLLFQISTPAGVAVANGTVTTGMRNSTSYSNAWSVCSLNAGGFIVAFESSTGIRTTVYNNAGTVTRAEALTSASSNRYYPYVAVSSSDAVYISWTQNGSNNGNGYIISVNSSGIETSVSSNLSGTYYPSGKTAIAIAPNGNIGFCYTDFGAATGYTAIFSGVMTPALSYINQFANGTGYYTYNPSIVALPNNHFVCLTMDTGNNLYAVSLYLTGGGTYSTNNQSSSFACSSGSPVKSIQYTGTTAGAYQATNSNSALVLTNASSNLSSVIASVNTSSGAITFSASATSLSTTISGAANYSICPLNNGDFAVVYRSATPNPTLKTFNGYTLANGATTPTPSSAITNVNNGYYLLGVATTTASAGTTGTIAINGKVDLSASYGTSATPIGFDYNPRNVAGLPNGNKGYVVNRVVTLTGLE